MFLLNFLKSLSFLLLILIIYFQSYIESILLSFFGMLNIFATFCSGIFIIVKISFNLLILFLSRFFKLIISLLFITIGIFSGKSSSFND